MPLEVSQIYIPASCLYKKGLMIGYNISGFCIHVIDVQDKITADQIERRLKDPSLQKFNSLCHANLILLGAALDSGEVLPEDCIERRENNNIWINLEIQRNSESCPFYLKDLYVCGYKYKVRCEIIAYDDQSEGRLLTLQRTNLGEDLFESKKLEDFLQTLPSFNEPAESLEEKLKEYFKKSDSLYEKDYDLNTIELLKCKAFEEDPNFDRDLPNLNYIIKQINLCYIIRKAYHIQLKAPLPQSNASQIEESKSENISEEQEMIESKNNTGVIESKDYEEIRQMTLYNQHLAPTHPLMKLIMRIFILFFQLQRLGFLLFINMINLKLPFVHKSLKDYNLFTHIHSEITFKLKIMQKWSTLLAILNSKAQSSNYTFVFQAYTKLYSGLTFMIMDTLLGLIFTYALYQNTSNLLRIIHSFFQGIHIEELIDKVEWLMGFPSGFKPNPNFNFLLGKFFIFLLSLWDVYTTYITPFEALFLKVFSFYGLCGLSFVLVIGKEVIRIYTLHVFFLYNILVRAYHRWLESFKNFFKIVQDKRINPITQKKEDYEFEWTQKIIATTIAFVLISLLPTLTMYYGWALWTQIAVLLVHIILSKAVDFINQFPLFLIVSHLTNSNQTLFPWRVVFKLPMMEKTFKQKRDIGNTQNLDSITDFLMIRPQKMPLGFIVSSFAKKISKLKTRFNVGNLVKFIFNGISIFTTITYNDLARAADKSVLEIRFSRIWDDIKALWSL